MVQVIKLGSRTSFNRAIKALRGLHTDTIPKLTNDIMFSWGKMLERDVKASAKEAGIQPHTGELFSSGIKWRQKKGKNTSTGYLFIRDYGIALDSMKPHYVSITPNRTRLLSWGLQARSAAIRRGARRVAAGNVDRSDNVKEYKYSQGYSVYVRPHPFIRRGVLRARNKLKPLVQEKLRIVRK